MVSNMSPFKYTTYTTTNIRLNRGMYTLYTWYVYTWWFVDGQMLTVARGAFEMVSSVKAVYQCTM